MKFVFPQNYNFANKLFGFIDYTTVILNIILGGSIYFLLSLFIKSIFIRISIFIILFLPFFLFSIIGFNQEKMLYILQYIYSYIKTPKVYLYRKYISKD